MELKMQDYMDIGYQRKYREFNRFSNPIAWIIVGLLLLGITLYMIGSVPKPQEDAVYRSPSGQEIVLSGNGHTVVAADDTVFLKDSDTQKTDNKVVLVVGTVIMLATLMGSVFYLMWAVDQCSEEGMKLANQELNKTEKVTE